MPVQERERLDIIPNINCRQHTPPEQFIEEIASRSHETRRIPDPYYYLISSNGELVSPTAHCLIKSTIQDKTSYLGQLEYQAVLATEQWAAVCNEGAIVWISPPDPYPVAKIIVSEIVHEDGVKKLFNRAILFDFDEKTCMKLAWNLTSFSRSRPVFTDIDQVRATPLFLDTKGKSWIDILGRLIDDPVLWTMIRDGEDRILKKETLRQAAIVQKQWFAVPGLSYSDEAKMAVMQMLGPYPESCPPGSSVQNRTALQVFSENALTYAGSSISKNPDFCRTCPACGKEINCVVKMGGSCPKCGTVKRCG